MAGMLAGLLGSPQPMTTPPEAAAAHRSSASLVVGARPPGGRPRALARGSRRPTLSHAVEALLFGLAIVGAAFLLSWAAEVAQLDISAGLAIAVLALIAVLPEYAVDFVFAWQGGASVQQYGAACPSAEAGRRPRRARSRSRT